MGQLLATLHSAPRTALQLKTDILKALLVCLRDSHRTRTVFRKVNIGKTAFKIIIYTYNLLN